VGAPLFDPDDFEDGLAYLDLIEEELRFKTRPVWRRQERRRPDIDKASRPEALRLRMTAGIISPDPLVRRNGSAVAERASRRVRRAASEGPLGKIFMAAMMPVP
jgi:hypothetical protein